MASALLPRDRGDFHVVVMCALEHEAECVYATFDEIYSNKQYGAASNDANTYTLGLIGEHNVVLAYMPGMGSDRATATMISLKSSFPNIKLTLIVGVCGGMPYGPKHEEIILGDIIISEALIRYDFGKQYPEGFKRRNDANDVLGPPSEKILSLLKKLKTKQCKEALQNNTIAYLEAIQQRLPEVGRPEVQTDILYDSSYRHQHQPVEQCVSCIKGDEICEEATRTDCAVLGCDPLVRVIRVHTMSSLTTQPTIHFGIIATGNTVMKSGLHRDALAEEGVVAVEMEGAGAWRYGPTIVIKGVCDYADSHKCKTWQPYAAASAAACAKAFLLEWSSEKQESNPVLSVSTTYFDVPRQRVKRLFGREDELLKISAYFDQSRDEIDQPRILALHAMGGQGKSQIALEYCYRARRSYKGIFWVNGTSVLSMTQSFVRVANQLDRSTCENLPDDDERLEFVVRTLEQWEDRWLLVFDNYDDVSNFAILEEKFLPKVGKGSILFTTRHQGLEELGDLIEIPPMPSMAGVELLFHRYSKINIRDYLSEGNAIVNRLGNLALAIDQASAYMHYTRLPIDKLSTFLPKYLTQREHILQHTAQNFWKYSKIGDTNKHEIAISAFTTWEMSFQQLLENVPSRDEVARFLSLSAFLDPTSVDELLFRLYWEYSEILPSWMYIFTTGASKIPEQGNSEGLQSDIKSNVSALPPDSHQPSEQSLVVENRDSWDPEQYWRVVYQIYQTSLCHNMLPATESRGITFSLHPLIRDWLQLRLTLKQRQEYTREAVEILTIVSSDGTLANFKGDAQTKMMIHLHLDAVLNCDDEFFESENQLGRSISTSKNAFQFTLFYADLGKYEKAEQICLAVVKVRKSVLGTDDLRTLDSMNTLATIIQHQGRYDEAEQICRRVTEAGENVLGKEPRLMVAATNNLATMLLDQGRFSEAEEIIHTLLELNQRVLGTKRPQTLTIMNNLAAALSYQGKYSDAEKILRVVLEARKQTLGIEHPDTLASMNNLACVLRDQNRNNEAEQICRQELKIEERVLGSEHPATLGTMNGLGLALSNQGKYDEAEQVYCETLETMLRVIGEEHPATLSAMHNFALVLQRQGRPSDAELAYRAVVEARKRVLGSEHPSTLLSMNNLAVTLKIQTKYTEAENVQLPVVKSSLATLGLQHPTTETGFETLLSVWWEQGRELMEVKKMLQSILGDVGDAQDLIAKFVV